MLGSMWLKPHEQPTHHSSGRGPFPTAPRSLFTKLNSQPRFINFLANEFVLPVATRRKNIIELSQDIHEHTRTTAESWLHTLPGVEKAYSSAALEGGNKSRWREKVLTEENEQTEVEDKKMQKSKRKNRQMRRNIVSFELQHSLSINT